jgi:spore coat polysaccharide biosynthesis protein SpsF
MNLRALRRLLPNCELAGVEINQAAAEKLKEWGEAQVYLDSILEVELDRKFDLTFTKGVLIHINPDYLDQVYRRLYDYSSKYICVAEYYNPTPVELSYRGHSGRLFKRDFAGEILQRYQDLELVDYGFVYHKDPVFPQDDISWFLLKKT